MLMTATVDPDHTVVETNEQDNTGGVTTTTDIRPSDLNIADAHVSEIELVNIGAGFFVEADVRNSGTNSAFSSTVQMTIPSACEDHTHDCLPQEHCNIGGDDCSVNPCPVPD